MWSRVCVSVSLTFHFLYAESTQALCQHQQFMTVIMSDSYKKSWPSGESAAVVVPGKDKSERCSVRRSKKMYTDNRNPPKLSSLCARVGNLACVELWLADMVTCWAAASMSWRFPLCGSILVWRRSVSCCQTLSPAQEGAHEALRGQRKQIL